MASSNIHRWIVRHEFLSKAMVMAAGTASLVIMATIPFFNNVRDMSRTIATKAKEEKELADKVTILSGLDEQVLDERVRILDVALPPKKDVVLYLSTIEGLSQELNLNFGGISLAPGEVTEATGAADKRAKPEVIGLNTLDTDIQIKGSEDNLYTFLRLIEETAPLMQIKQVKLSTLGTDSYLLALQLGMLYAKTDIQQVKGQITLFTDQEEKYFQELDKFRKFASLDQPTSGTGLGKADLFEGITLQP